jgi:hypothetical protein
MGITSGIWWPLAVYAAASFGFVAGIIAHALLVIWADR